jgi:twitching motility protein PilT
MPHAIDTLFDAMLAQKASDLHLAAGYPPMLRVRGDLVPLAQQPVLTPQAVENYLQDLLSPMQRQIFAAENDLDFAHAFADKARFRGNYFRKTSGMGAVFRVIPTQIQTLEELRLPEVTRRLTESRAGLILVTGPTGSGKSTTLAAMLDAINSSRRGHILTIEDPVEFVHRPQNCQITHREVGRDVPSFADAIRSAGREDADVILVGELRNAETMRLALQAASSGALVFATVHTNSAASTIDRFINAFPAEQQPAIRGMLAECLTGIVAQQLLKRADGKGRLAVQEILLGNRAVAAIIRDGKTMMLTSLMQSGRAEGMQTMDSMLESLVRDGSLKAVDALTKAVDKENFAKVPFIADQLSR